MCSLFNWRLATFRRIPVRATMAGGESRARSANTKVLVIQLCLALAAFIGPSLQGQVTLETDAVTYVQASTLVMGFGVFALCLVQRRLLAQRTTPIVVRDPSAAPHHVLTPPSPQLIRLVFRAVLGLLLGTAAFFAAAVLFGAPLTQLLHRTLLWAALQSCLTALPLTLLLGASGRGWTRIAVGLGPVSSGEEWAFYPGVGALAGSWLGAIPIPLDWDRPWQVWPVSCVYGCMAGYLVGILVALVVVVQSRGKSQKARV